MTELKNCANRIDIRDARMSDIERIAEMYRSVAITEETVGEVLGAGENSFRNRGGMFRISSKDDILSRLQDAEQRVIVGGYDDTVCAMLWYGMMKDDDFPTVEPNDGFENINEKINKLRADGKLGYSKEIISLLGQAPHVMPFALFFDMMSDYVNHGIPYTMGEVYMTDGYEKNGVFHDCHILNGASFQFLEKSGGTFIGTVPQKRVELEGFTVFITPRIFLWDTEIARETTQNILNEKGWEVSYYEIEKAE